MIRKAISITKIHEKWLKDKFKKLEISESELIRRLLDEAIKKENSKET